MIKLASQQGKKYWQHSVLISIGYLLSPLSWWNDTIINIPIAYVFSIPFSLISDQLYLPAFILGYWLSNLTGFLLIHQGINNLLNRQSKSSNIFKVILVTTIYTLLIVLLVLNHWLEAPTDYL